MICIHCGQEMPADSKYCPYCGGAVSLTPPSLPATPNAGEKHRMTKPVKILIAVGAAAAILWLSFTVFCFYMAGKEKKASENTAALVQTIDTVYFHGIPFTNAQMQCLDPTNTCLLILYGAFDEEARAGLGYRYDKNCSTESRDVYRMKDSAKTAGIQDLHLYYTPEGIPDYCSIDFSVRITDDSFRRFIAAVESATGNALNWYAEGNFFNTETLTVGTSYYCIAETEPAFVKIQIHEDGTYSVSYDFTAEYGGYTTYAQYTERAVSADYESLQNGTAEACEFYFTGKVIEKSDSGAMRNAVVCTETGECYKLYYISERGYICPFAEGDTVKVYGWQKTEAEDTDGVYVSVYADVVEPVRI